MKSLCNLMSISCSLSTSYHLLSPDSSGQRSPADEISSRFLPISPSRTVAGSALSSEMPLQPLNIYTRHCSTAVRLAAPCMQAWSSRDIRSQVRTFTVKLCPEVSGRSWAILVNTGCRFAGGCAIFAACSPVRPTFVSTCEPLAIRAGRPGPSAGGDPCCRRTDPRSDSASPQIFLTQ